MTSLESQRMQGAVGVDKDLAAYRKVKPFTLRSKEGFKFHVYDFKKTEDKFVVHVSEETRMGVGGEVIQRRTFGTLSELLGTVVGIILSS